MHPDVEAPPDLETGVPAVPVRWRGGWLLERERGSSRARQLGRAGSGHRRGSACDARLSRARRCRRSRRVAAVRRLRQWRRQPLAHDACRRDQSRGHDPRSPTPHRPNGSASSRARGRNRTASAWPRRACTTNAVCSVPPCSRCSSNRYAIASSVSDARQPTVKSAQRTRLARVRELQSHCRAGPAAPIGTHRNRMLRHGGVKARREREIAPRARSGARLGAAVFLVVRVCSSGLPSLRSRFW